MYIVYNMYMHPWRALWWLSCLYIIFYLFLYKYNNICTMVGGIALRVVYYVIYTYRYVCIFMLQGIIHKLYVVRTEPYLFILFFFHFIYLLIFSMFIVRVKNKNTRLKLLYAQYSFVRKVPVVVNDQTHTHTDMDRYGLSIRESLVHTGNIWLRVYIPTRKEVDNWQWRRTRRVIISYILYATVKIYSRK